MLDEGFEPERRAASPGFEPAERDGGRGIDPEGGPGLDGEPCSSTGGGASLSPGSDDACSAVITMLQPDVPDPIVVDPAQSGTDGSAAAADAGGADAAEDVSPAPFACPPGQGEFGAPEPVTGLGVAGALFGPALSGDGGTLYFGVSAGGTEQIYRATRGSRDTAAFSLATEIPLVNSPALEGTPFLTADDQTLYFYSDRNGGVGNRDLWSAPRMQIGNEYGPALPLGAVNSSNVDLSPSLSRDGLELLFVSARAGGLGAADLYRATRVSPLEPFRTVTNVLELNSGSEEGRAVLSADGLRVVFSSARPGGLGGEDVYEAARASAAGAFSTPRRLPNVNSRSADRDVALSSDETELFLASERQAGSSNLWRSVRACPTSVD
jgi:hypothetical protein